MRIFSVISEGRVRHSAAPRTLNQEPDVMDICGFILKEMSVSQN